MSNLPGESSLKSIESGFANFKTRKGRKKNKKNRAVKEQAFAKSKTIWIFALVCKLKKSREHILAELPDRFPDKLEILAERIHVLDTLRYALEVQDKDNEQRLESELGIRILEKENKQLWEGLESEFSSIMTLCDQLNQKFKHLHDDDTGDGQLGAIDMANGLFHALDKLEGLLSRLVVKTGTSSLKSIESGFANFETRAVCKKNRSALEPVKEHASAKSETNWVFDLIVKLKKIEEHIRKELLRVYGDELEKLKEFIRVLEKLEHELKVEHKENGKLWEGLESEFSSMMTLCDQLNEKFEHLHDAVTARERLIYEDDSSDSSDSPKSSDTFFDFIMLVRSLGASGMVLRLFNALDKLDDLCSRLVSSESTVGNCDKGLQKLDIEKVDYNENKVPSRTFRGKRMSTPIEDKGDKGLQKLDIENVKVDYNENKVPSRTFKGKRMSTPKEDKENNVIDIKSHDILVEQLEIAKTSKIPVVMLFYSKEMKPCRDYLPKFDDLPTQYRHFNGDIKFFRVGMECAATEFKVRAYPTVLVLMPGSCGLQVVGRLSIEETVIVPAFVKALKTLLDERLWEYCGYMGALQQV